MGNGPERAQGEVESNILRMREEVDALEKMLGQLESRISAALRPEGPQMDANVDPGRDDDTAECSTLASNLASINRNIHRTTTFVRSLTNRVDL